MLQSRIGTPEEQWANAGTDVALGHCDAKRLHEIGTAIIGDVIRSYRRESEFDLELAEEHAEELQREINRLRGRIAEIDAAFELFITNVRSALKGNP